MATTIITKNGSGAPLAGDLQVGELAIDLTNKKLYSKEGTTVFEVGATGGGAAGTFTDLTATNSFTSVGIDDNATSTAIAIDSGGHVKIGDTAATPDGLLSIRSDSDAHAISIYEPVGANENWQIGVDADGDLGFYDSGSTTASITFQDGGNVGIGDTNPSGNALSVGKSVGGAYLKLDDGTNARFDFTGTASQARLFATTAGFAAYEDLNIIAAQHIFSTGSPTGEKVRITSSGNVGIGTSSPARLLHLESVSPAIRIKDTSGTGTVHELITTGTDGNLLNLLLDAGGAGTSPAFIIKNVGTELMRIDASGNVGIGTNNPAYPLDFVGPMRIQYAGSDLFATIIGPANRDLRIDIDANDDADSFVVRDLRDGSERFKVRADGNVSIGTSTTVSSKLHVIGSAGDTALFGGINNGTDTGNIGGIKLGCATDNANRRSWGIKAESTNLGTLGIWGSSSNSTDPFSGTQHVSIDSIGNVGINSTAPSFSAVTSDSPTLEIKGAVSTKTGNLRLRSSDNSVDAFVYADSTNGLYLQTSSNHPMRFATNATERMRIDSSGNVIVGGTSFAQAGSCSIDQDGNIAQVSASGVASLSLFGGISGVSNGFKIESTAANKHIYTFLNGPNVAVKIDDSGNLLVGKTSTTFATAGTVIEDGGRVLATTSNEVPFVANRTSTSGTQTIVDFYINSSDAGTIKSSAGGTPAFASASDIRLKDNVTDHESELANVMALRPVRWDWKDESLGSGEGFIAQELEQTAWADLVSEGDNGYKQVSGLGLVETRLIKAIQEQQAMIEELKAEVAALKGA